MAKKQKTGSFEDISSYSSKDAYRRNKKKKKRTGLKAFLGILFSLFIIVGAFLLYVSTYLLGDLKTTSITKNKEELGIASNVLTNDKITNIAMFGVDSRLADGTFSGRSDAIMILSLDNVHGKIKLTSIMRDARVYVGEESPYDTGYDKLTNVYAYGGPELTIRVLNQDYGLDIEDYITVNFSGMAKIVDAFGGVDIDITDGEIGEINKNLQSLASQSPESLSGAAVYLEGSGGVTHLDGNQAVAYGRIRNIGNDNARVERQQEVLSALLGKANSISVSEYPGLVRQLAPLCETSLGFDKMIGCAQIALTDFTIERLSIPSDVEGFDGGNFEDGMWMWNYDTDVAGTHIRQFIFESVYQDTNADADTDTDDVVTE